MFSQIKRSLFLFYYVTLSSLSINTMPMVLAVPPSIWIMGRARRTVDYSSCSDLRKTTGTLEGKTAFDSADTFPKSDQSHGFTGAMT